MPYELPADPRTERRARIGRWVSFLFAAVLVAVITYLAYVGYEGSRQLTDPPNRTSDCRTPATMGWPYEAINYDLAGDEAVEAEADPSACTAFVGVEAGADLTSADGVRLAGWYVPAASGIGPTGPTVVLVHGWGSNKSNMLGRASMLHESYNLLFVDLRNHGQSAGTETTQGVLEQADVTAAIDWLVAQKAPDAIALLGTSMGGATVLNAADTDARVAAVIAESTHATIAGAAQARLERAGYPLAVPGSWAILLGGLVRTGLDMSVADPVRAVTRLDDRDLLLIMDAEDDSIGSTDAEDMLAAAQEADVSATLEVCEGAGHGMTPQVCSEAYASWVLRFLERALGSSG
jgi:pimeloyl-ACP methyl ester carboxylesterase